MNTSMNASNEPDDDKVSKFNMSNIDSITLDYFTNRSQYNNILKKKEDYQSGHFDNDKKFYKFIKKIFKESMNDTNFTYILPDFHIYYEEKYRKKNALIWNEHMSITIPCISPLFNS